MNNFAFRTLCIASLATLLSACGIGAQADLPIQTAAAIQTDIAAPTTQGAGQDAAAAAVQVAGANMPAPDCAADGCKGLRIIDGNAEAYRYDALLRAGGPQS